MISKSLPLRSALLLACTVISVTSAALAQDSTTCTAEKQATLDTCAVGALQDCFSTVGANCEQRYNTTDNSVGRFREVCCCKNQETVSKSAFLSCRSKTLSALADLKAVLGTFAVRTRSRITKLSYSTCNDQPCDF